MAVNTLEEFLENKQRTIKQYATNPVDTGSTSVQIALLTQRISYLTEHVNINHNDKAARYALLVLVAKRNKFLKYLKRKNEEEYNKITSSLGIRKK